MKRPGPRPQPLADRFWEKVEKGPDCWLWTAATAGRGYGYICTTQSQGNERRMGYAHRIAYELCVGPIPEGRMVLHSCDVPHCVNPAHLKTGTHQDNMDDMVKRDRQASGDRNYYRKYPERVRRGEEHHNARLTRADVDLIRKIHPLLGYLRLGRAFNVSRSHVRDIVKHRKWAD